MAANVHAQAASIAAGALFSLVGSTRSLTFLDPLEAACFFGSGHLRAGCVANQNKHNNRAHWEFDVFRG